MSSTPKPVRLTAGVVKSFAANNHIPAKDLPDLIRAVQRSFSAISNPAPTANLPQSPAVSVKKSITTDYLICLEDGRKFRTLKRHLSTTYGMTAADYRAKWGLPPDYPMVAPSYSAKRRDSALASGLGAKSRPAPRSKKAR